MSTPLDDRARGEATQAWQDARTSSTAEQTLQERALAKPPEAPALTLDLPAPTLGFETRVQQDLNAAARYGRELDQRQEKFADNRQPDLLASKERDRDAEHGRLGDAFEKARDADLEK